MGATAHVVARYIAKSGKEQALKTVLTALIAPARREIGCYQYDLLENPDQPREFCFVQRWDTDKAFNQHLETAHMRTALADSEALVEAPPEITRYRIV